MRQYFRYLLPLLLVFSQTLFSSPESDDEHRHCHGGVFQYSTIGALMEKYLDGGMSFQRLSRKGNFGIGTFNGLDGEMIAVDGHYYQIKHDGKAYPVEGTLQTPFATVVNFSPDKALKIPEELSYEDLQLFLTREASPGNQIQAIRIDGRFRSLAVRSVPKQHHPYRTLAEINKAGMVTFEYKDIEGTLVGFRFPEFMGELNVAGYHFHFIDKDRKVGGQVLALTSGQGNASIQTTRRFKMILPGDDDFNHLDLSKDHCADPDTVDPDMVDPDPDMVDPAPDTVDPDPDMVDPAPDTAVPNPDTAEKGIP